MSFLDIAKSIKNKISQNKEIEKFYIINNTLGKNLILLVGKDMVTEAMESHLKEEYGNYIEDIYRTAKITETNYLFKQIEEIAISGEITHRNSSYKSWMRNTIDLNYKGSQIIAGYSFKGGMGRSSTIAYLSEFLYQLGKKIVILDCDFEAPGISAMFFKKNIRETKNGIIDYLIDINLKEIEEDFGDYFLQSEVSKNGGNLYVFPSGIDFQSHEYLNKISKIDFNSDLYNENFIKLLKKIDSTIKPDVIFIDLRAGINESNGFILNKISNKNILFFNSEEQNIDGMNVVLEKVNPEKSFLVNSLIRFNSSEISDVKEKEFEDLIKKNFTDYVIKSKENLDDNEEESEDDEETLKVLKLLYRQEFLDSLNKFKNFVEGQFAIKISGNNNYFLHNFIDELELDYKKIETIQVSKNNRTDILKKLQIEFNKVTGGSKFETEEDLKYFYFKEDLSKIVNEQIFLILGAKGSGKSSLFEIFTKNYSEILKKLNSNKNKYIEGFSKKIMSDLTSEHFDKIKLIAKNDMQIYERFWKYLTVYQLEEYLKESERTFINYSDIYDHLTNLDFSISIDSKLKELNRNFYDDDQHYTIVYDELDVAFNKNKDEIISSLISFWRNNIYKYANLRSKIFLRKDLFESLTKLDNKTHLEINSYDLVWKKKEILSLILKIIVSTLSGEELKLLELTDVISKQLGNRVELVDDENIIIESIYKIFGKKLNEARKNIPTMDNWIIQELSDGRNDITPRTIYKFMSAAISDQLLIENSNKEIDNSILFNGFKEYEKNVLKACSDSRILEYREEYKTYSGYIDNIKSINYGKFSLDDYVAVKKGKSKIKIKAEAKDELSKLVESGFLIDKNNQYQVAKIYFETLGIKKSKQGAKSKTI